MVMEIMHQLMPGLCSTLAATSLPQERTMMTCLAMEISLTSSRIPDLTNSSSSQPTEMTSLLMHPSSNLTTLTTRQLMVLVKDSLLL